MRFLKRIIYGPTNVDFNYKDDRQHMKEIVVSENGDPAGTVLAETDTELTIVDQTGREVKVKKDPEIGDAGRRQPCRKDGMER